MRYLLLTAALLPGLLQAADTLSSSIAQEVVTNSQSWRSSKVNADDKYVIQLVSVRETKNLPTAADIRAIKGVNDNLDVVYHPKRVNGVTWHTLVWGTFNSKAEGEAMFSQLPAKWQKMQPWVRPISSIEGVSTPPVKVAKPKPVPKAAPVIAPAPRKAPVATRKTSTVKKHPVSPPDRSTYSNKPSTYQDPYENYGEDFSNHESAMAAQGTYPYLKVSVGQAEQDTDALQEAAARAGANLSSVDKSFSDAAYEIAVGLDIGYYLGVELGYIDASELAAPVSSANTQVVTPALAAAFKEQGPFGFKGVKASALVKLPIDARRQWQPFIQVGAINWEADIPALGLTPATTNKDTNLFYAAGLDYKFTKKWALGLKYSAYDMDAEASSLTADLTWRWEGRN